MTTDIGETGKLYLILPNPYLCEVDSMFCRVCGKNVKSNNEIRLHLVLDHSVTLKDYYSCVPHATKYCNKCKRELPVTEFYIDRHKTSGYRTQCIRCIHPGGHRSECPLCHRVLHESAIVRHLKEGHGIAPRRAYREFIKRKRCPKCQSTKPLKDFYRKNILIKAESLILILSV